MSEKASNSKGSGEDLVKTTSKKERPRIFTDDLHVDNPVWKEAEKKQVARVKAFEILVTDNDEYELGKPGLIDSEHVYSPHHSAGMVESPQNFDSDEEDCFEASPLPENKFQIGEDDFIGLSKSSLTDHAPGQEHPIMEIQTIQKSSKESSETSSPLSPLPTRQQIEHRRRLSEYMLLKKERAKKHRSRKKKYQDLYEEHLQMRYVLYYADETVQQGLQTKSKILYHQMIGDITESFQGKYMGEFDHEFAKELYEHDGIFFQRYLKPNVFNFFEATNEPKGREINFLVPFSPQSSGCNTDKITPQRAGGNQGSTETKKRKKLLQIGTFGVDDVDPVHNEFKSPTFKNANEEEAKSNSFEIVNMMTHENLASRQHTQLSSEMAKSEIIPQQSKPQAPIFEYGERSSPKSQQEQSADTREEIDKLEGNESPGSSHRKQVAHPLISISAGISQQDSKANSKVDTIDRQKEEEEKKPTQLQVNLASFLAPAEAQPKIDPSHQMQKMRKLSQHILENYDSPNIGDIEIEKRRQARRREIEAIDRRFSIKPTEAPRCSEGMANYHFGLNNTEIHGIEEGEEEQCSLRMKRNSDTDLPQVVESPDHHLRLRLRHVSNQIDEKSHDDDEDPEMLPIKQAPQGITDSVRVPAQADLEALHIQRVDSQLTNHQPLPPANIGDQSLRENMRSRLMISTAQKMSGNLTTSNYPMQKDIRKNSLNGRDLFDEVKLFRLTEPKSGLLKKQAFIGFKNPTIRKNSAFRRSVIKQDKFSINDLYKNKRPESHSDLNMSMQSESGSESELGSHSDIDSQEDAITIMRMKSMWVNKCEIAGKKLLRQHFIMEHKDPSSNGYTSHGDDQLESLDNHKMPELGRHKTSTFQNVVPFKSIFYQNNMTAINMGKINDTASRGTNLGLKKLETDIPTRSHMLESQSRHQKYTWRQQSHVSVKKSSKLQTSNAGDRSNANQSEIMKAQQREQRRQRRREIRHLKKIPTLEEKEEEEEKKFERIQVKALRRLKKVCETLKGHPITTNCFEEEEEDVSKTDFDGTKSEFTNNMNINDPHYWMSNVQKSITSKDPSVQTPNRANAANERSSGNGKQQSGSNNSGFRMSKASQCRSEDNLMDFGINEDRSNSNIKSALAVNYAIPAFIQRAEIEGVIYDNKRCSRRQTLNITDGLHGINIPAQFDLRITEKNFSHRSKVRKSPTPSIDESASQLKSSRLSQDDDYVKQSKNKHFELPPGTSQRTLLSRVADIKAMEYIREQQRAGNPSATNQLTTQNSQMQPNLFLDNFKKESSGFVSDEVFKKEDEDDLSTPDPQNLEGSNSKPGQRNRESREESKTSFGQFLHMKTAKFYSNINSPGRKVSSQESSRDYSDMKRKDNGILDNLVTSEEPHLSTEEQVDQVAQEYRIPSNRQTGITFDADLRTVQQQSAEWSASQAQNDSTIQAEEIQVSEVEMPSIQLHVCEQRMEVEDENNLSRAPLVQVISEPPISERRETDLSASEPIDDIRDTIPEEQAPEAESRLDMSYRRWVSNRDEEFKHLDQREPEEEKLGYPEYESGEELPQVRIEQISHGRDHQISRLTAPSTHNVFRGQNDEWEERIHQPPRDRLMSSNFPRPMWQEPTPPSAHHPVLMKRLTQNDSLRSYTKMDSANPMIRSSSRNPGYDFSKMVSIQSQGDDSEFSFKKSPLNYARLGQDSAMGNQDRIDVSLSKLETFSFKKLESPAHLQRIHEHESQYSKMSRASQYMDHYEAGIETVSSKDRKAASLKKSESPPRKRKDFSNIQLSLMSCLDEIEKAHPTEALYMGNSSNVDTSKGMLQVEPIYQKSVSLKMEYYRNPSFLSGSSGSLGKSKITKYEEEYNKMTKAEAKSQLSQGEVLNESSPPRFLQRESWKKALPEMFEIKEEVGRMPTLSSNQLKRSGSNEMTSSILDQTTKRKEEDSFTQINPRYINKQANKADWKNPLRVNSQPNSSQDVRNPMTSFDQLLAHDRSKVQLRDREPRSKEIVIESDESLSRADGPELSQSQFSVVGGFKPFQLNFESRADLVGDALDGNRASLGGMIIGRTQQQFSEVPQIHKEKSEVVKPIFTLFNPMSKPELKTVVQEKATSLNRLQRTDSINNDLDELQSLFSKRKGKGLQRKGAKSLNPSPVVLSKLTSSSKPKIVAEPRTAMSNSQIQENRRINAEHLSSLSQRPQSPKSYKSRDRSLGYPTNFGNMTTKAKGKGPLIEIGCDKRLSHQDRPHETITQGPNQQDSSKGQLSPTSPMSVINIPVRGRELNQSILAQINLGRSLPKRGDNSPKQLPFAQILSKRVEDQPKSEELSAISRLPTGQAPKYGDGISSLQNEEYSRNAIAKVKSQEAGVNKRGEPSQDTRSQFNLRWIEEDKSSSEYPYNQRSFNCSYSKQSPHSILPHDNFGQSHSNRVSPLASHSNVYESQQSPSGSISNMNPFSQLQVLPIGEQKFDWKKFPDGGHPSLNFTPGCKRQSQLSETQIAQPAKFFPKNDSNPFNRAKMGSSDDPESCQRSSLQTGSFHPLPQRTEEELAAQRLSNVEVPMGNLSPLMSKFNSMQPSSIKPGFTQTQPMATLEKQNTKDWHLPLGTRLNEL